MLELQQLFGDRIPNVEFVLATSDRPMVLLAQGKEKSRGDTNDKEFGKGKADDGEMGKGKAEGKEQGEPPLPVLRFCSSPAHADIQVGKKRKRFTRYQKAATGEVKQNRGKRVETLGGRTPEV